MNTDKMSKPYNQSVSEFGNLSPKIDSKLYERHGLIIQTKIHLFIINLYPAHRMFDSNACIYCNNDGQGVKTDFRNWLWNEWLSNEVEKL